MELTNKAATIKALTADEAELTKINAYTLKEMNADEVFVFKVIACSNEIDRDQEAFTVNALHQLSELYRGKTMILNHENRTENQIARIYDTEVIEDAIKTTALGESYTTLILHVFLPRIEKNADLIAEIEAGIKKEVSVGCNTSRTCSVCGEKTNGCRHLQCGHKVGQAYDGKLCAVRLDDVKDAYEVSFVAVPAQRDAGTTKAKETAPSSESTPSDGEQATEKSIFNGFLKYLKQ